MAEARQRRDEVADAVKRGYTEAMVGAKAWKGTLGRRPWAARAASGAVQGLTGAPLEAWVDAQALKYPDRVH